ncbi:MAG: hypothetical protein ACYSUK_12520 [Planctomycetota bacterium]|jgi:hypothetical protein
MSTRCNIVIKDQYNKIQLYRHCDGYPDSKHGIIANLPEALEFAWRLPRMEASDFAAAIVRAWKKVAGNIYIDGTADLPKTLHGDIEYLYIIEPDVNNWRVRCYDVPFDYAVKCQEGRGRKKLIFDGHIGDPYRDNE